MYEAPLPALAVRELTDHPVLGPVKGIDMLRTTIVAVLCAVGTVLVVHSGEARAQDGYAQQMSRTYNVQDWNRFYHYPYVYYPQNFWSQDYFRSSDNLYNRYPAEMQVPVYNKAWHNFYPSPKRYYSGHHFRLDVL